MWRISDMWRILDFLLYIMFLLFQFILAGVFAVLAGTKKKKCFVSMLFFIEQ